MIIFRHQTGSQNTIAVPPEIYPPSWVTPAVEHIAPHGGSPPLQIDHVADPAWASSSDNPNDIGTVNSVPAEGWESPMNSKRGICGSYVRAFTGPLDQRRATLADG